MHQLLTLAFLSGFSLCKNSECNIFSSHVSERGNIISPVCLFVHLFVCLSVCERSQDVLICLEYCHNRLCVCNQGASLVFFANTVDKLLIFNVVALNGQ